MGLPNSNEKWLLPRFLRILQAGLTRNTVAALLLCWAFAGCASGPGDQPIGPTSAAAPIPLDARMQAFARLHGQRDFDKMSDYFAAQHRLQSPVLPHPGSGDAYIRGALSEPFSMEVSNTEILYATASGAKTRSRARVSAPARFALDEKLEAIWRFENGQWRITELEYPEWVPVVGTWRRAGGRGENSIELRVLPGGGYLIYADRDRSVPTFRGSYTFERGTLVMTDTSSAIAGSLDKSPGVYAVIAGRDRADFRKLSDDNRWRSERFEGIWSAAQ